MVTRCPNCSSLEITFVQEGQNVGQYECKACAYIGQAILEEDEFEEGGLYDDEDDNDLIDPDEDGP